MKHFLKGLRKDRRGNVLAIAGAALPLLVGAAGLATDTINWTLWKRELQRAADSAAIAGVYERVSGASETETKTAVNHDLTINNHNGISLAAGYPQVTLPGNSGQMRDQVRVVLAVRRSLPFSSMFMSEAPLIITRATAATVPGPGDPCVRALEPNASSSGIMITGNASIYMPNCIMHSNSPATNSAYAKGSSEVYADAVSAVGGIQQSNNWHVNSYDPYAPAVEDPFADVTPNPSDMNCTNSELNEKSTAASVGTSNCFSSFSVKSNSTLDLDALFPSAPRTIYINGGDANIQGNLKCTNCTIVLTNNSTDANAAIGQFKVNAGSEINMTAPTDGKFKGIAIYQDRRAKDSPSAQNKINGHSSSVITGALYFPSQELDYNGTGNTDAVCTMFVSRRIKFSGNSTTSNKFKSLAECAAAGLPNSEGTRRVRLVA